MRRVRSAHGARAARPATATGSAKRRREPKAPPDRASKFGTELSLLLSERSTKLGGRTVRELNQAAIRASQEPRERPASEGARIWMDWDKDAKSKKISLAYGSWRDNFVVVNKPSGVPLLDDAGRDSLEQRISRELVATLGKEQAEQRSVIFPHRIDKWVSGLQVVALDNTTAGLLQRSLRRHMWHKRYRALVQMPPGCAPPGQKSVCQSDRCGLINPALHGTLTDPNFPDRLILRRKGKIESRIAKQLRDNTPSLSDRDECANCSKVAPHLINHPFVIRHLLYRSVPEGYVPPYLEGPPVLSRTTFLHLQSNQEKRLALYEAVLHTGKTHQLRLHFSESGFPIVADPYYNAHFIEFLRHPETPPPTYGHLAELFDTPSKIGLQAFLLELPHPYTNRIINLELPMPALWASLGFSDKRVAPVPEGLASPQERFERFLRELEHDDPALYRPAAHHAPAQAEAAVAAPKAVHASRASKRVFVGNFPTGSMSEEDARLFFGQYGAVGSLRYLENAVLVDFKTEKGAALLLTQSDNITINGRTLSIAPALKKAEVRRSEEGEAEAGAAGTDEGEEEA